MNPPESSWFREQVQAELADYKAEFAGLKNQDVTIRRLEDTIEEMKVGS